VLAGTGTCECHGHLVGGHTHRLERAAVGGRARFFFRCLFAPSLPPASPLVYACVQVTPCILFPCWLSVRCLLRPSWPLLPTHPTAAAEATMPTVGVNRDQLFEALGKKFTDDEFQLLCFEFGIELDEVTTASEVAGRQDQKVTKPEDDEVIYKIDIPANRYDLLCIEGLITALQVFQKQTKNPAYVVTAPKHTLAVRPATAAIRPYVVAAVLRGIRFDKASYNSFLDLQDKLHFNICRRRSLVSMGTHDLGKVDGASSAFVYDARRPEDIAFVPLAQEKEFKSAKDLLDFYRTDPSVKHLKE
jgi:hypothetical protein